MRLEKGEEFLRQADVAMGTLAQRKRERDQWKGWMVGSHDVFCMI